MDILIYPNPILRKRCKAVAAVTDETRRMFLEMAKAMYQVSGIGLAAPQIGIDQRLIVVDIGDGLISLANPKITKKEGESALEEGCLCLPGVSVKVKRAKKITVEGLNQYGQSVAVHAEGLKAHAFQQEIDHINGVLIIDYASLAKRWRLRKKLKSLGAK